MSDSLQNLRSQLENLKGLFESGVLPEAQYLESKATLERRIVDTVLAGNSSPQIRSDKQPAKNVAVRKPANGLVLVLGLLVVIVAGAGYWWKGSPALAGGGGNQSTSAATADAAGGNTSHNVSMDQIAAMTEKLSARLKEKPDDAEGWSMLARSYSVLGRNPEALAAYEKATVLRKDDAQLLADYADSLAVKSGSLDGDPMKQVERALKVDPRNIKALFLAGTHAFDQKNYKLAMKHWELATQSGKADDPFVQQMESGLIEARQLAGLPAASSPLREVVGKDAGIAGASVSGTINLSSALAKQAQAEDTVFVFARSAEGGRMPLAILRKQVKDLPLQFTLDDSTAMSPASALSTAKEVIVSARISKSGNAMPQPGDLTGQTKPVPVGSSGLKIEIQEVVKP